MIQLIESFKFEEDPSYGGSSHRRFPIVIDEGISMIMEMEGKFLGCCGCAPAKGVANLFKKKYKMLSREELTDALKITSNEFYTILNTLVPCIGCRRSVETLHNEVGLLKNFAFYPLVKEDHTNTLSLAKKMIDDPNFLCNLFYCNSSKIQNNLEAITRSAGKSRGRCSLHSLKDQKMSINSAWEIYEDMSVECRKKITTINKLTLHEAVEKYLNKHNFCVECKARVYHAYEILVEESEPEEGFVPSLYYDVRFCTRDHVYPHHIHVECDTSYVSTLLGKALPDLINNRRDRHAKTMEIAQEEILICIGICIFERLHRIQQRFREEERSWEIIMCLCSVALKKGFELAVEKKLGVSQLELLCAELQEEENLKKQRKDLKKLKKKRKKEEKKAEVEAHDDDEEEQEASKENTEDVKAEIHKKIDTNDDHEPDDNKRNTSKPKPNKGKKIAPVCVSSNSASTEGSNKVLVESESTNLPQRETSETSRDCGYSSGNNNDNVSCSSRDGSEIDSNDRDKCTVSSLKAESTKQFVLVPLSKCSTTSSSSSSNDGLNSIPYRSLEEQLECLTDDDIPSIPEEEVSFFMTPAWEKQRNSFRELLRARFEAVVSKAHKSTIDVQSSNANADDVSHDNQNTVNPGSGCDEESLKKQQQESSTSATTSKQQEAKKQPRAGGKNRRQGKSRYKGKNRH